jgi:RNA polymerase sigma-70 factor (sigma-E family)
MLSAPAEPFGVPRGQGDVPGGEEAPVEAEIAIGGRRAASLEEIYAAHAPRAGRLAFLLLRDPNLAEDVAQEAFARFIARLPKVRDPDAIDAYLRRSVVNLCRKHWRRSARERAFLRRQGPIDAARTSLQPDVGTADAMHRALEGLPYRQRAALVLRFYEDLSERDAARAIGCAIGTIKSLTSRGLAALREELAHEDDD